MGYKLAGFDVLGCNEIDPKMADAYKTNHNPKYCFVEPIQTFKLRDDLPEDLFNLDILDGSPPCSSFSMAGAREDDWGKEKKFREGQTEQVLDTLFFDFIDLAKKLQPKVVVAENVKGLLLGAAKEYVLKIYEAFDEAGYYVNHWLMDASIMGVPQKRERVFFLAMRKDIADPFLESVDMFHIAPKIDLIFNEPKIPFKEFKEEFNNDYPVSDFYRSLWEQRKQGDDSFANINGRVRGKENTGFGTNFLYVDNVCGTLTTKKDCYCLFDEPRYLSDFEAKCVGSYPQDYDFSTNKPQYLIGMSVPPVMTAQVASRIYEQWLSKM
jgi:DNA (cytosine-5)-methyltransferase 1